MLAQQFVDKLEGTGLLHPDIIAELRRQLADSKGRVTVEALAKLLVDNGHLTKFQATKLVAELRDAGEPPAARPAATTPPPIKPTADDLDLAPLEGNPAKPNTPAAAKVVLGGSPANDEIEAAEVVEDVAEIVDDVTEVEVVEVEQPVEIIEEVTEVVEVVEQPRKRKKSAPVAEPAMSAGIDSYSPPRKPRLPSKSTRNPWEDFRILGVGSLLILLLMVGAGLLWWFFRGTADELIQKADQAYEGRSYETADKLYSDFVERFTTDDRLSYAKVRRSLAQLRKVAETVADPNQALKTAQEVLPPIAEEPGIQSERGDLTGVLLTIAEKYNAKADSEKETASKKTLMQSQTELQKILDNPQFVGTAQRNQQANRIARIEEERQRILRDIARDEDLVATIAKIKEALAQKDTAGSYALRSELIRKFPQLEINPELNELVLQATAIQKELVSKSNLDVQREDPTTKPPATMLVNSQGTAITDLQGTLLYVNALGAVYCLEASTGNVLWRRYIGRDVTAQPLRLSDTPDSDTLVTRAAAGVVQRIGGTDGSPLWKSVFPEAILPPSVDNEQVFVATPSGQIVSLDGITGDKRWSSTIPQPVPVAPGVGKNKPNLYVPGEHSNLYVLSRSSGQCQEVIYLGHAAGSIAVAPVYVLGHLFVFENPAPDYSTVRIFSTNDEGLELKPAQNPFRLRGNIVVPPQIDGRRVIVITDLGEIAVLDVELASSKEKVSRIAAIPASEPSPRQLFALARSNEMWICSNRFARYDIQVSRGQIDRKWIKEDGDLFVGAPQQFSETIFHVRTVRGTQGIRVAAVRGTDGEEVWKTDIGVPISALSLAEDQVSAVTSQAALFQLPVSKIADSTPPVRPLENPGLHDRSLLFTSPLTFAKGTQALFNKSTGNQVAYYDPQNNEKQLQLVLLNLGGSQPSGTPAVAGNGLLVPLKNGQLVYIDPATGRALSSPFQPPLEAGASTTWVEPAVLDDGKSAIVSGSMRKIYRLQLGTTLNVVAEVDAEQPLRSRLAPFGDSVIAVAGGDVSDTLQLLSPETLKPTATAPLQGRVTWGPYAVGQQIWLHTDSDGLQCFDANLGRAWQIAIPASALVNAPIESGANVLIAAKEGRIWSVDPTAGKLQGSITAGEPITGSLLIKDDNLIVGGEEGVIIKLGTAVDSSTEEQP